MAYEKYSDSCCFLKMVIKYLVSEDSVVVFSIWELKRKVRLQEVSNRTTRKILEEIDLNMA